MRVTRLSILFVVLFAFTSLMPLAHAQTIDAVESGTSGWLPTIDQDDLSGGVGTDLTSDYDSYTLSSYKVVLDITATGAWTTKVKISSALPSGMKYYVQRINNDTGLTGGYDSAVEVTTGYTTFFTGSNSVSSIEVKVYLKNVSLAANPGNTTSFARDLQFSIEY